MIREISFLVYGCSKKLRFICSKILNTKSMEDSSFVKISWIVKKFSYFVKSEKVYIESPEFLSPSLNRSKWLLRVFPAGDQTEKFLKVDLVCTDCQNFRGIKVCWELSFVSKNGQIIFNSKASEYKSFHKNTSYEVPRYPTLSEVYVSRRDDFIINENITIQCRIWKHGCRDYASMAYEACTEIVMNKYCLEWPIYEFENITKRMRSFRNGNWKPTFKIIAFFSSNYPAMLNVSLSQINANFPSLHLSCTLSLSGKKGVLKQWINETSFYNHNDCLSYIDIISKDEVLKYRNDFYDQQVLNLKFDLLYSIGEQRSYITSSSVIQPCNPSFDDSISPLRRLVKKIGDIPEDINENKCKTISELSASKDEFRVKSQSKVTEDLYPKDQCDECIPRKDSAPLNSINPEDHCQIIFHGDDVKFNPSKNQDCKEIHQKVSTSPKSNKNKLLCEEKTTASLNEQVQPDDKLAYWVMDYGGQYQEQNAKSTLRKNSQLYSDENTAPKAKAAQLKPANVSKQLYDQNNMPIHGKVQHENKLVHITTDSDELGKEQNPKSTLRKKLELDDSSVPGPEDRPSDEMKQLSELRDDLMSLYQDQTLSDFALRIDKKWFPVHKTILAARSPVLKAMLTSDMMEANADVLEISDLNAATLEQLLQFMYTGSFSGSRCCIFNLYYAADKYQVMSLRQKCSDVMKKQLSSRNVCEVLSLADRHQDETLKYVVQDFIALNDHEIIPSNEWRQFLESCPLLAAETMQFVYMKKLSSQSFVGPYF